MPRALSSFARIVDYLQANVKSPAAYLLTSRGRPEAITSPFYLSLSLSLSLFLSVATITKKTFAFTKVQVFVGSLLHLLDARGAREKMCRTREKSTFSAGVLPQGTYMLQNEHSKSDIRSESDMRVQKF